jgi:cob(I)alamin adenosyltransferase
LRPIYGREYIHPAGNVLLCKPHFARAVKRREEREERDLDATREKVLV